MVFMWCDALCDAFALAMLHEALFLMCVCVCVCVCVGGGGGGGQFSSLKVLGQLSCLIPQD